MRGSRFSWLPAAERLVSLLMAFGLGYMVLSSPWFSAKWAVLMAWVLVGVGAMAKLYLFGFGRKSSRRAR